MSNKKLTHAKIYIKEFEDKVKKIVSDIKFSGENCDAIGLLSIIINDIDVELKKAINNYNILYDNCSFTTHVAWLSGDLDAEKIHYLCSKDIDKYVRVLKERINNLRNEIQKASENIDKCLSVSKRKKKKYKRYVSVPKLLPPKEKYTPEELRHAYGEGELEGGIVW